MEVHDPHAADRMLLRKELHTMRERVHIVERRLHDIEMAINLAAIRADGQSEELDRLREEVRRCRIAHEELAEIVADVIERMDGLLQP